VTRDLSAVGCLGVLTVKTRGADGPGEVQVSMRGATEIFIAYSDEPLPKGARVLIVDVRSSRTVDVVPSDTLFSSEPRGLV
jgi:hypothetical protein